MDVWILIDDGNYSKIEGVYWTQAEALAAAALLPGILWHVEEWRVGLHSEPVVTPDVTGGFSSSL